MRLAYNSLGVIRGLWPVLLWPVLLWPVLLWPVLLWSGLMWSGLAVGLAVAQEVEDHRSYPGTGGEVLRVLSTADLEVFEPFILRFQAARPDLGIDYTVASSTQVHRAIRNGAAYDLVLSSAMDLQFQLANDGFARSYRSDVTAALPDWARWRDLVFAFTAEPAVAVISTERFAGLPLPRTRQDLITILRDNPERFRSDSHHGRRSLSFKTSGSTGRPLIIYHDRRSILENIANSEPQRAAATALLKSASGYRFLRIERSSSTPRCPVRTCPGRRRPVRDSSAAISIGVASKGSI